MTIDHRGLVYGSTVIGRHLLVRQLSTDVAVRL
jgi:hypothetical protein